MAGKDLFYWTRRLSIFMIAILYTVAIIISVVSNHYFATPAQNEKLPVLIIFGDGLIPLLFFLGALIFRNRYCAIGAVSVMFFNIFLRLSSVIIFRETFMPLDYFALKLLFIHTNFEALQAVLGKYFYLWLIPAALAVIFSITYCCFLTWKTAGKEPKKYSRISLAFVFLFLILAMTSNVVFPFFKGEEQQQNPVTPLPIVFYNLTRDFVEDISANGSCEPIPLPQESREILIREGVISTKKEEEKQDLFDRIIIVALESFDYHYISGNHPEIPRGVTPNINRLSREFVSMENYFSAAQPTSWGLTALILSRFDYERDKIMPAASLFSALKLKGFHSFYFASSPGYFEQNRKNYKRMFQPDSLFFREEFFEKYNYGVENEWGLSDRSLYEGVYRELETTQAERFIAVISTIDTHYPYHHCELTPEEESAFPNRFLQSLYSADRELNTFLQKLMQNPKLYNERTLIIVTADHTATHGENYTKRSDFSPERIPLIFITPNRKIFRKLDRKKYASSVDLAPTILTLTGNDIPETFMGRSLFSGKNCAITATHGPFLQIHYPDKTLQLNLNMPENKLQTAFRDFYYSFYGK